MTQLLDGFERRSVAVEGDRLLVARGGTGPPVVLLHGYPQTHHMWHAVAPVLAERFAVHAIDLPGYGGSDAPALGPERYAKRRMAADVAAVMAALGHDTFAVVGHDRGGRVAYRLALDHPRRVTCLAVLDIVPTGAVWNNFSVSRALRYYHWTFLAQPEPLPETLIGHDPVDFLNRTLASWTRAGDLSAFHPEALAAYRAAFADPARLRASCMDYRAGATLDWRHDDETREAGTVIDTPCLVLWGTAFDAGGGASPLAVWREWAPRAEGQGVDCGHFLCEENPAAVVAALVPFLAAHASG